MTEPLFLELLKFSPVIAILLLAIWYLYKELIKRDNNYQILVKEIRQEAKKREEEAKKLLEKTQAENLQRELKYTSTIDKLTESLNVVHDVDKKIDKLTQIIKEMR